VGAFFLPFLSSHAKAYGLEKAGSSLRHIFRDISKVAIFLMTMVGVIVLVGDLFSNAMSQEQGNIENVNRKSPSSFEALFPLGYNGFRANVRTVRT
jgi:predicted PurR-regulated permease PerM